MLNFTDHYADLEGGLRALLSAVSGPFSTSDIAEIEEFIDAREYGLALQTLAAILLENSARLDGQVIEKIQKLAGVMSLHSDEAINGIVAEYQRQFRVAM